MTPKKGEKAGKSITFFFWRPLFATQFLLPGMVNMHADGAVSGQCDGAQFQSHLEKKQEKLPAVSLQNISTEY